MVASRASIPLQEGKRQTWDCQQMAFSGAKANSPCSISPRNTSTYQTASLCTGLNCRTGGLKSSVMCL